MEPPRPAPQNRPPKKRHEHDEARSTSETATVDARIPYPFKRSTRRGPFTTHNGPWYHWVGQSSAFLSRALLVDDQAEHRAVFWDDVDALSGGVDIAGDQSEVEFRQAVRLHARHCNSHGHAHGGFLSAFADGLLATAIFRLTGRPSVTIRLTTDFLRAARAGDWMQGTARVERATRSLAFVEARAWIGETLIEDAQHPVFTAQGIFKFTD